MKLLELYEDLFQYVCRLNRAAKTQAHPEYGRVRSEVRALLDDINRNTSSDVRLSNQVKRLELPMIFFLDNLIATSQLRFASDWATKRLAYERNELAGDEHFFNLLEKDLTDTSDEAAERLVVYYSCFGLGFAGMYQGQPDRIRQYMEQIFPRIRQWMDTDPRAKIAEEAYRHTKTDTLTEPPSHRIILVAMGFLFLGLCVLASCYVLYYYASQEVTRSVKAIIKQSEVSKP